jgi:hypothetical protein
MRCCRRNARPMRDCKHHPCTRISEISLSETSAMLDGGSTTHREREKKLKANTKRRRKGGVGSKLLRRMDGQKASRKEQPNGEGDSLDWIFGCEPADFCSMLLTKLSSSRSSSRPAAECSLNVLCLRHLPPPAHTARCSPLHWLCWPWAGGYVRVAGPPERGSLVLHAHARTYAGAPATAGERCRSDGDGSGGCRRAGRRPVPATSAVRWHGTVQESLPPPEKKGGVFRVVPATACSVVPPALAGCGACCLRVLCDSHFTVHTQRRRKLTEPGIKKG